VTEHDDDAAMFTQQFWDERYAGSTRVWSGRPNQRLVENATDLAPATALDVGCGEGADVVWLAQQGWLATGVDVSQVAVDRAAAHAEESGVGTRTSFHRVDVIGGQPLPGAYELVLAAYLHPPLPTFATTYGAVSAAVRPGGRLLVVAHHPADAGTGLRNPALAHLLFAPERLVTLLPEAEWEVEVAAAPTRAVTTSDGTTVTVTDTVVRALRR
jgi:2-polyprenyl-3-methyl-5-hydroxy-6-metoxy-1,4-benzoquinol methylase